MTIPVVWLLLSAMMVLSSGCASFRSDRHDPRWTASEIRKSRLQPITVAEIEAGKQPGIPVPEPSAGWTNFKRQILPGDQVWYFYVPAATGREHAVGRRGFALYRADTLIATFTVSDP